MVGVVSLVTVVFGAATAYVAERFPAKTETLETIAGFLLLGGFALIGSALPAVL